jgi:hypothetical protein
MAERQAARRLISLAGRQQHRKEEPDASRQDFDRSPHVPRRPE